MIVLCAVKLVSWSVSLGSGTSGRNPRPPCSRSAGDWAPRSASPSLRLAPGAAVDVRVAALVGMAAIFAGASRALLASVVFAFETTQQSMTLLPLLGGCTVAVPRLVSHLMRNTIMTEKIVRRGAGASRATTRQTSSGDGARARRHVARARHPRGGRHDRAESAPGSSRTKLAATHQGFPVVAGDQLVGVVTRRDLMAEGLSPEATIGALVRRPPIAVRETSRRSAKRPIRW